MSEERRPDFIVEAGDAIPERAVVLRQLRFPDILAPLDGPRGHAVLQVFGLRGKKTRVTEASRLLPDLEYPESQPGDTAAFEPALVDFLLGPSERRSRIIIGCDEGIDVLLQLLY